MGSIDLSITRACVWAENLSWDWLLSSASPSSPISCFLLFTLLLRDGSRSLQAELCRHLRVSARCSLAGKSHTAFSFIVISGPGIPLHFFHEIAHVIFKITQMQAMLFGKHVVMSHLIQEARQRGYVVLWLSCSLFTETGTWRQFLQVQPLANQYTEMPLGTDPRGRIMAPMTGRVLRGQVTSGHCEAGAVMVTLSLQHKCGHRAFYSQLALNPNHGSHEVIFKKKNA